jgi:1-acyl-sn-glycerol-3-phosphate acyltransferase
MTGRRTAERSRLPLRVHGDPWLYAVARLLLVPLATAYGRLRVTGAEHVPSRGGVLVVANHPSDIDPILVAIAVRRPLRFMADAVQFERGFVGPAIRLLGAFPVRVASPDLAAVRTALKLLERGEAVALFPEGDVYGRSRPAAFRRGIGLLAARSGAPVVPVAVSGAERLWTDGRLHRPRIDVRFGPPLPLTAACPAGRDLDCLTEAVQVAVTELRSRAAA